MEFKKQQMEIMHSMCQSELKNLQMNLQKFLEESKHSQKVLHEVILKGNNSSFIAFDRYMSQVVTIFNMARKFNIHLQINNLKQTVIDESSSDVDCLEECYINQNSVLNDFTELNNKIFKNAWSVSGSDVTTSKTNLELDVNSYNGKSYEKNTYTLNNSLKKREEHLEDWKFIHLVENAEKLLEFLLPEKCLDHIQINSEFEAYIVNVTNQNQEFFICQTDDYKTLFDLGRNKNFKRISNLSLPLCDVFCVLEKQDDSLNDCIWRAIKVPQKEENNKGKDAVYLIDFGEDITLTEDCVAYEAPQHYKEIAPLAVKCKLEGIENTFFKTIERNKRTCEQLLQKNVFKKLTFRVVQKEANVLHVVALDCSKDLENLLPIKSGNKVKFNPFLEYDKVSEDEDQGQANFPVSNISAKVGDIIQIMVTHVISPISFYAIINSDLCSGCEDFSWHVNQIGPSQRYIPPPQINDIVLSQYYRDDYFYRAKVIDIDQEHDRYKVFYIDFGNTETVPLRNLAECWKEQLGYPFRAILFHLSNLSLVNLHDVNAPVSSYMHARFQHAIENVVIMILDQILNVEIIEKRNNDFFIALLDEQYDGIPNMLVNMGVAAEL